MEGKKAPAVTPLVPQMHATELSDPMIMITTRSSSDAPQTGAFHKFIHEHN